MKPKHYLLLALAFLYANFTNAQNTLDNIGLTSSTPASVAYSLRLLSSNYTGPLLRIKVGSSFYDVYPDASAKNFALSSKISASISAYNAAIAGASTNALSTIISGSTDALVAIWYDQSGNGVHVLSSSATAKIITAGSILTMSGQPTINFYGNNSFLTSSTTVNYSSQTNATVNAAAQDVASTDYISGILSTGDNGGWGLCYDPTSTIKGYWVDASGGYGARSNEHSTEPKIVTGTIGTPASGTSSAIYINNILKGTKTPQNIANGTTNNIYVGTRGNFAGRQFIGNISETMMFPKTLSNAEQTALETSQSIYLPPSVTMTSSASGAVCAGTNVTFTAASSKISSPSYQWYKNGTAISGETNAIYATTALSNNDQISVRATPATVSATTVTSNLIANLDAGNSSSYNGSGNIWTDLTGNGNKVTLSNTGYSSVNGGGIALNTNGYGTQTLANPPFNSDFTWSTIFRFNDGMWDWIYNVGGYNGLILTVPDKPAFSWYGWYNNKIDANAESSLTNGNYYMLTFVRSGNAISCYLQASPYGVGSSVSGNISLVSPTIGKGPGGEAWPNGIVNVILLYNKALTQTEITQNYNTYAARFGLSAAAISSNTITVTLTGPSAPVITDTGDGCVNKTTLTTPTGLTSYAWYKDNVIINGATSNTYTPTAAGDYKVQVSNGTCTNTSAATTIYACGVTADGKMVPLTTSTTLVSNEGGTNFGTGLNDLGSILNTTGLTTTKGAIGATTAVLGGVISATNAITSSIGVIYNTDSNFGTYSTANIQSNVAAGTYTTTISGLSSLTTYYAKAFITNKAGTSYGNVVSFTTTAPPPPAVGDSYGGGKVFYVFQPSDPGYVAGQYHGLIAATSDTQGYRVFGCRGWPAGTSTALGTGAANTTTLLGCSEPNAAKLARAVRDGGYTDWFLPSKDELNKLYLNKNLVGNFIEVNYWSSSGAIPEYAWYQRFSDGTQNADDKNGQKGIRAIRTF